MSQEGMHETLIRLEEKFDSLMGKLDDFRRDVVDLEHTLYGNGQPGVKQKVIELETTVKVLKWSTALAVSVGGLVTTILGYFLLL